MKTFTQPSRFLAVVAAALAAALLAACGGGGEDRTKAQVRLVHAADAQAYPALQLTVDGTLRQGNVAYGQTAAYAEVDPDKTTSAISAAGSPTALLTFTPSLTRNRHYTVLAFGGAGTLRQLVVDENLSQPANNRTSLRVINAAPDAGNLDVYITAANDTLATAVAARAGAVYGEVGPTLDVASGSWRVRVTGAGNKDDVRLDVSGVALGSREVATLVLTPSLGGTLVHALLLVQEGGIAAYNGTQARVRVLAGVASSGVVTASLGTAPLATGVGSPAVSAYTLVPAGSTAPTISVNGGSVAAPATTLAAGADYTLLVYGALASPAAAWLEDRNQLPTAAGRARVRLVNATAAIAGSLALSVDGLSLAGGVAAGAASAYGLANASTTAALVVTAAGVPQPLYSATAQTLATASNYSVFVVGPLGASTGLLVKDR